MWLTVFLATTFPSRLTVSVIVPSPMPISFIASTNACFMVDTGDTISVTYTGGIRESYPAGIDGVVRVQLLDDEK